jgi:hypothetical protein
MQGCPKLPPSLLTQIRWRTTENCWTLQKWNRMRREFAGIIKCSLRIPRVVYGVSFDRPDATSGIWCSKNRNCRQRFFSFMIPR